MRKIVTFAPTVLLFLLALSAVLVEGQGAREVRIFNPLPYSRSELIRLDLSFLDGEAYNGTIRILDASGSPAPLQLVNCSFYSSGYYRACTALFQAELPPSNVTRYFVVYQSAPPRYNVSAPGGLSLKRANVTLVAFNATGSYVANVTNGLLVRGPGYTAVFSNTSLVYLVFDGVGGNLVFSDWPLTGFVLFRNLTILASGYDLAACRTSLLLNGTLESKIEQVCSGATLTLRQVFTFSGLAPIIRVDAELQGWREGQIFFPYLRLSSAGVRGMLVNSSFSEVVRGSSYVPAPRWFALQGERAWLVVTVNYTALNVSSILEKQGSLLLRAYVNETNPLRKSLYEKLAKLQGNFTNLLLASQLVEAGRANLTTLQRLAALLHRFQPERDLLLLNLTELIEEPERRAARLLVVPQEGALNIAYQVERAQPKVKATLVLTSCSEDPQQLVRSSLVASAVKPAVLYAPIEARLSAPERAYIDDYVFVSADVRAVGGVSNVSVKLSWPERALSLVGGRRAVNFSLLRGFQRVEWLLRAVYEGAWFIALNVTSPAGNLVIERKINVSLPPIVPRVVIQRSFNVTIECVDAQGRPLAGYLVNLYENATRNLVRQGFTNGSGLAQFLNVSAGVYQLEVTDGFHSARMAMLVYSNRNLTVRVGLANLGVRVELADGQPLSQAAVHVRDENGSLICAGFTDASGSITCAGLPRGNYTVSVRWQGSLAGSTRVQVVNDTEVTLRGLVQRVIIYVALGGRPAAGATVNVYSAAGTLIASKRADERGIAQLYLLPGPYRFKAAKGQYSASETFDTRVLQYIQLNLALMPSLWVLIAMTGFMWLTTTYMWHRRTSYVYKERERYRRLLQRLEELHSRGEVEERFYVKLKQEYEAKLNELSRGEWE